MNRRGLYLLGAALGGTLGGLLPRLWGESDISGWGIIFSMIGSFAGLWLAYKISRL